MRSTALAPASIPRLYAELQRDAVLAEAAGFHSLWLSEHHFWYDGWCPAALVAGASALGATTHLHIGTGVFLLPLHDPARVAAAGATLEQVAPGRFELAIGLGYRDPEYDGLGISRRRRGRRADAALDLLATAFADGGPALWVGGIAAPALRRGASRGLSLLLPSSMRLAQVRDVIDAAREVAAAAGTELGRVGIQKYAWLTDGSARERQAIERQITTSVREYAGSWWPLRDAIGFEAPGPLDEQMRRIAETSLIGPATEVANDIGALAQVGVDLVVLHVSGDYSRCGYRREIDRLGADVLPLLR